MAACRLGFAVKVLGRAGLKGNDSRRWQSGPHLRVSLEYLREIFAYLDSADIRMYRMSSDLAPYATHPDLPQFHNQIQECRNELSEAGRLARDLGLRLSFHPSQFVIINSPDPELTRKGMWDLLSQSELLDAMEMGPEAVVVIHTGGAYDDKEGAMRRWIESYRAAPEPVRRRLVLENDDLRFSAGDVYRIHEATGVPLVFDNLHHWCNNPERADAFETLHRFARTWPSGVKPKMHYSSPRTEMREVQRRNRKTGKPERVLQAPVWTGHADFVNPFEFIAFCRAAGSLPGDVLLEAKAKDLALQRLRRDLALYAPDVSLCFGAPTGGEEPEELPAEALAS